MCFFQPWHPATRFVCDLENKQTNNNQGFETKMAKYQSAVNTIAHSSITWGKSTSKSLEIIYVGHSDN